MLITHIGGKEHMMVRDANIGSFGIVYVVGLAFHVIDHLIL
jgi:hypothetical protein